ncbi:hypothetical protein EBZ35_04710 [bacterium]|nr:hypothetical protein [bacterium]
MGEGSPQAIERLIPFLCRLIASAMCLNGRFQSSVTSYVRAHPPIKGGRAHPLPLFRTTLFI